MILVDTNVWIDFFRGRPGTLSLTSLLKENQVVLHPWIFGELMIGGLGPRRKQILNDLNLLPRLRPYSIEDLHSFVEQEAIAGKGLSLVDCQLLYAAILEECLLWTSDRNLFNHSEKYGVAYRPEMD